MTDRQAIIKLSAILGVIIEMSDDVKNAKSPFDAQGKLLRLQNSIQKNRARVVAIVKETAIAKEDA